MELCMYVGVGFSYLTKYFIISWEQRSLDNWSSVDSMYPNITVTLIGMPKGTSQVEAMLTSEKTVPVDLGIIELRTLVWTISLENSVK